MLSSKQDYFSLSREQGLPSRCPLLERCERRADTLALANKWPLRDAPIRAGLKPPFVPSVGEPAYLIGGENNFVIGGQCPEVGLFETTMAIMGLSGVPLTKGQYDKYLDPQYQVIETGHYSECAEYVRSCLENSSTSMKPHEALLGPEVPRNLTLKWLFNHVPVSLLFSAAGFVFSIFVLGVQATRVGFVREVFGLEMVSVESKVAQPYSKAGSNPSVNRTPNGASEVKR